MTDGGLQHLRRAATVPEVLLLLQNGYTEIKFFPARQQEGDI
jgi:2-dehydro-3-deoxyphosphogluconate aldolase / (4S)-4-hydroxy-2-oxoglutarate aldolase